MSSGDTRESRLAGVLGNTATATLPHRCCLATRSTSATRHCIELVGDGPGAPIDQVLRSLSDMQQQLAKMAATLVSSGTARPLLQASIRRWRCGPKRSQQPQPLVALADLDRGCGSALRSGNPRQQLAAIFNGAGGPAELCPTVVNGRYPFPASASEDVGARRSSPGCSLPAGCSTDLSTRCCAPMSTCPGNTWRLLPADSAAAPVCTGRSCAVPARRGHPRRILSRWRQHGIAASRYHPDQHRRRCPSGDVGPRWLRGRAIPVDRPDRRRSPGRGGIGHPTVRLVFDPPPADRAGVVQETGPWSMFRLFARGRLQQAATPERYNLTFQVGERQAVFEISHELIGHPLHAGVAPGFPLPGGEMKSRCPRLTPTPYTVRTAPRFGDLHAGAITAARTQKGPDRC